MTCRNQKVNEWVKQVTGWLKPDSVVWCDGSENESRTINNQLVKDGIFTPLNEKEYPDSYWCRSHPNDVARVEEKTFICSKTKDQAGPLNNWKDPKEMYEKLQTLMAGCMKGKTMYVVPYLMGPDGSPFSKVGFELTDSLYVVANMRIMARIGAVALKNLKDTADDFVRGVHGIGSLDPEERYIAHFPDDKTIISFNTNYGGNALQGKKCFSLRIASVLAAKQGWLAEHMLILGITKPSGEKRYIAAAFPSACGKTNLAMLIPPKMYLEKGWKVETVGDDIAWLNFGRDGQLYAINPEAGFFGVAPGTSMKTNPNAMLTIRSNTIFTNTALDLDKKVPWWEGMDVPAPSHLRDWLNNDWSSDLGTKAAHPNSRFTAPARQCPCIAPEWESPQGVPLSAIVFGGRRAKTAPLVYEATSWNHGAFLGATMASETTAAAAGKVGELRRDPMAMRPFIGYHVADYFKHWLAMGTHPSAKLPRVFHVNWFRTNAQGKFVWPGFGENMRVLEWIVGRCDGTSHGSETALGYQPTTNDLNRAGLQVTEEELKGLLEVNPEDWRDEIASQKEFFKLVGTTLPQEYLDQHEALAQRLGLV